MANNFNFQASLKLNSTGFRKGVNQVKSSLAGLKASFLQVAGALGAGLGFTQLIASVKNTATELSTAMNTLKNVSYQTKIFSNGIDEVSVEISNFSDNLEYVKRLSKDYHQDLVAITDNFAKFTAACKKTNLGLEDQKFVYEALTRAAAYYHLSADRTSDMMNAVTQMMSKGKVAAEELRRQLGNTLPGAFNMMAAAIGVSTAELDKMMRNGEVLAEEVLPKFAAMLNSTTQAIEFDSIQSSLNDFKNAWYEFVQASGAEDFYKKLVDGGTNALNSVSNNFDTIKNSFKGLIAFLLTQNIWSSFIRNGQIWLAEQEKQLNIAKKQMGAYYGAIKQLEAQNMVTKTSTSGAIKPVAGAQLTAGNAKAIIDYNNKLLETIRLQNKLGIISKQRFAAMQRDIERATAEVTGLNIALSNTGKKGTASITKLGAATMAFGAKVKGVLASIGAFMKANWIFMVIGLVTSLVSKAKQMREEAEKIRNIAKEYENETIKVKGTLDEQSSILRNNLKIVKDQKLSDIERARALAEVNKQLGLTGKNAFNLEELDKVKGKYAEITEEVEKWIKATQKQALVQHYANQMAEITAKKTDAKRRQDEAWKTWAEWEGGGDVGIIEGSKAKKAWGDANAEIAQYDKALKQIEADMKAAGIEMYQLLDQLKGDTGGNGGGGGIEADTLADLMDKYNKEIKKLENQLKEGAITQDEFTESFEKLVQEYWKSAAAFGELSIDKITQKMNSGKTLKTLENWYYTLSKDAAEAAKNALLRGFLDETMKSIDDEIEASLKEIDEYFEKLEKANSLDLDVMTDKFKPKERGKRNTLFDYDKSNSEKLGDEFELSDEWLEDIKEKYGDLIKESNELGFRTEAVQKELDILSEKYRYAAREAETLEAAMNYAKIQEDIKNLKGEIGNLVYSGVKDFATSLDRVVSAAETLKETMNDTDASGWEKFMAVFNMITQIVDTALGMYETITTIQQMSATLGAAKIAEQTALNALLKEELALRMAAQGLSDAEIASRLEGIASLLTEKGLLAGILGLKQAEATQTATNTALKGAEATASMAAAGASGSEAIAGATASGAKMPYPLNLIAIATGIAAVIAALASMKKFATGGIVGGNSTHGDRNMVRVNSGEMILNKAQQGTLWSMLNGKGSVGGNVEFKIRGADLVGTINNYSKKISK